MPETVITDEQLRAVERIRREYSGRPVNADGTPTDVIRAHIAGELAQVGLRLRGITVTGWGRWGAEWHIDVGVRRA